MNGMPIESFPQPQIPTKRPLPSIGYPHEEGIIAEFECREAAVFAHLSYPAFEALSWREKANTIAFFRLHRLIEGHLNAAAARGD